MPISVDTHRETIALDSEVAKPDEFPEKLKELKPNDKICYISWFGVKIGYVSKIDGCWKKDYEIVNDDKKTIVYKFHFTLEISEEPFYDNKLKFAAYIYNINHFVKI